MRLDGGDRYSLWVRSTQLFKNCERKQTNKLCTTLNDGYLGLLFEEERSEVR